MKQRGGIFWYGIVFLSAVTLAGCNSLPSGLSSSTPIKLGLIVPLTSGVSGAARSTVEGAERELILRTLKQTGGNKTRAADILGISLKTLHNKLHKYKA